MANLSCIRPTKLIVERVLDHASWNSRSENSLPFIDILKLFKVLSVTRTNLIFYHTEFQQTLECLFTS